MSTAVALNPIDRLLLALRTTAGGKVLMAVTGAGWVAFLLLHLYSNLHVFAGAQSMNTYYAGLKASAVQMWSIRAVLALGFVLHVVVGVRLWWRNRQARPERYAVYRPRAATPAARAMMWTGPLVGLYVVYHLLHFTTGHLAGGTHVPHDEYGNVVRGFQSLPVVIVYVLANVALGFHLWHGAWSFTQSLGLSNAKWDRARTWFAVAVTLVIAGGFISVPLAVVAGIVS